METKEVCHSGQALEIHDLWLILLAQKQSLHALPQCCPIRKFMYG